MGYCQSNSSRPPNVCGTLPHFLPGSRHHFSFLSFLALIHHQEHHWKVTMPWITASWHRMGCQDNKSRTQTPPRVRSVFLGGARACSSLGPCRSPRARRCTPPRACSILLGPPRARGRAPPRARPPGKGNAPLAGRDGHRYPAGRDGCRYLARRNGYHYPAGRNGYSILRLEKAGGVLSLLLPVCLIFH